MYNKPINLIIVNIANMLSKNVATAKKPYCKVCQDAGKSESEYTSHWVKDLSGKTTCPTLLNTECRYCYKTGHTTKFCSVLAKNNKEKDRAERKLQATITEKPKPVVQKKQQNGFAALCDDSDSDEEVSNVINEYPELQSKKKVEVELKSEAKTGWAAIVAKPAVKKTPLPTKPTGLVMLSDYIKPEIKVEVKVVEQPKVAPWATSKQVVKKSWADETDSEDEDEDEEELLPEVNFEDDINYDYTW